MAMSEKTTSHRSGTPSCSIFIYCRTARWPASLPVPPARRSADWLHGLYILKVLSTLATRTTRTALPTIVLIVSLSLKAARTWAIVLFGRREFSERLVEEKFDEQNCWLIIARREQNSALHAKFWTQSMVISKLHQSQISFLKLIIRYWLSRCWYWSDACGSGAISPRHLQQWVWQNSYTNGANLHRHGAKLFNFFWKNSFRHVIIIYNY